MNRNTWSDLWLGCLHHTVETYISPEATARGILRLALPEASVSVDVDVSMDDDAYTVRQTPDGHFSVTGGKNGVLYGTWKVIFHHTAGLPLPAGVQKPKYTLRMINCWDNADGSVERGYCGSSLFFKEDRLCYDEERIRFLGLVLSSVGFNTLCINNVNVRFPADQLIDTWVDDMARLADLLRPYAIRLMVSVDYSMPLRYGVPTADPLAADTAAWWKDQLKKVYAKVPDLAGLLVKADSEHRPGPFTYGRDHADGANMLADALTPFGGVLVWRCFVYNCKQDWRDSSVDRPMAAYQHYAYLDGRFRDNVILQIKHGPFDFQVREPLSPLLLAMKKTKMALEVQLAQEYTGHQIDLYTMAPMWREIFDDMGEDRICATAAVGNFGSDLNWTGHPLAAVNLYTWGIFSWDPSSDPETVIRHWIRLTYSLPIAQQDILAGVLLRSRSVYEKYTAPLGLCWMVRPGEHYGPSPDGYEYDFWGTYHRADRNAVGIDRTGAGTGYLLQYPEHFQALYGSFESCPDNLKLFFYRVRYDQVLPDGRTLIQRIYDDHFEGATAAVTLREQLKTVSFPSPDKEEILERMDLQVINAQEWCDIVNSFFYRFSGVEDAHGRKLWI